MGWRAIGGVVAVLACAGTAAVLLSRPPLADVGVLVIDTRSGARQRVTSTDGTATWSRDGRTIFVSGEGRFARFAPDGRQIARHTVQLPDIDSGYVALAPDERRIAYVVSPHDPDELNTGNLVVRSLDGDQSVVRLTRARGTPAWSPDGKSLAVERWSEAAAYGAAGGSPPQIVVVPATGGAGTPRTASPGGQARWLPDGRLLVPDADSGTLVVTRVGDTQGRVVVTGVHVGDVPWDVTPDGTTLVVAGQGDVNYDLTLVDLKSSRSRVLPSEPATDVRWSADNTRLAVVAGERILLVDPSRTAAPRVLTRIPGRVLTGLAWSPDGRSLAVTASVPSHED